MQERDGIEIKAYQTSNRNEFSPMMDEQMTFTKQCDVAGDIIYLNPLILIPEKESPFASAERRLPVEFPYKQSETINTVITLPNGYTVEHTKTYRSEVRWHQCAYCQQYEWQSVKHPVQVEYRQDTLSCY